MHTKQFLLAKAKKKKVFIQRLLMEKYLECHCVFGDIFLEELMHKTCLPPFLINAVHLIYSSLQDATTRVEKTALCDPEIGSCPPQTRWSLTMAHAQCV